MKNIVLRIIAVVSVLLLATALAILFLGRTAETLPTGEIEASPYPCTWEMQIDGSCKITVGGEIPENASWGIMNDTKVIEAIQQEGTTVFTVKPVDKGSDTLVISMRESGLPVNIGADFRFQFSVNEKKKLSLSHADASKVEADAFLSDSGEAAYWKASSVGGLFIYLTGNDWSVAANEGVSCFGPTANGEHTRLEIIADEGAEVRSLVLKNNASEKGIEFSFRLENGALCVEDCSEADLEALESEKQEETELYGNSLTEEEMAAMTDEELEAHWEASAAYWAEQIKQVEEAYAQIHSN